MKEKINKAWNFIKEKFNSWKNLDIREGILGFTAAFSFTTSLGIWVITGGNLFITATLLIPSIIILYNSISILNDFSIMKARFISCGVMTVDGSLS